MEIWPVVGDAAASLMSAPPLKLFQRPAVAAAGDVVKMRSVVAVIEYLVTLV